MKSKSILLVILMCLFLIASFYTGRYYERSIYKELPNDSITVQVEKLIIKNDSIVKINDSINYKVIEIEKTYEKTVDDIIRNNPIDDYSFFANYIERYRGSYYTDTIKDCELDIRGTSDVE